MAWVLENDDTPRGDADSKDTGMNDVAMNDVAVSDAGMRPAPVAFVALIPPLALMRRIGRHMVDLLLPPLCPSCFAEIDAVQGVCGACWSEIGFIEPPVCDRLGTPLSVDPGEPVESPFAALDRGHYDRVRAVARHDGPARAIVHGLKYRDRLDVVRLMARLMARSGAALIAEADLVVPVPLHWRRRLSRRFNQSAEIARRLAATAGKPYLPDAVIRRQSTRQQVGLTQRQRAANVRRAFSVPDAAVAQVAGRHVLLIDDVFTSGATASAAARVLKRAGADTVDVLVFTRVVGEAIQPI